MSGIVTVKVRQGTAAQWAAANPVLAAGEPALETDTGVEKIGDGVTAYASLPSRQSGTYGRLLGDNLWTTEAAVGATRPTDSHVTWTGTTAPTSPAVGDFWARSGGPTPVIIDTDWWTDYEEMAAFRVLAASERMGLIDIRAIVMSATLLRGPGSLDAFLTAEGRPDIPIGKSHTAHTPTGTPGFQATMYDSYAHKVGLEATCEDAVTLMRRVLASEPGQVDMICAGHQNNMQDLLQSAADSISPLTGLQLVTAKVRHMWVMGGQFPSGAEHNFDNTALARTSANYVVANWPTPITFLGYEIGPHLRVGGSIRAYTTDILYTSGITYGTNGAWDSTLVRIAAMGDPAGLGFTTVQGTASVNASTGATSWVDSPTGPHRYVVSGWSANRIVEDINRLCLPSVGSTNYRSGVQRWTGRVWTPVDRSTRNLGTRTAGRVSAVTATETTGLILNVHADDLGGLTDTNAVSHWEDRTRGYMFRQLTGSAQPVYAAALGGKKAVTFTTGKWLAGDVTHIPRDLTVYATVYVTSTPSADGVVLSSDGSSGVNSLRGFHLKFSNTGVVTAVGYNAGTGVTSVTTGTIATTTWAVVAMRAEESGTRTSIQALLDGVGPVATSYPVGTFPYSGYALGSRFYNDTNLPLLGSIHEVRLYDRWHDDATVTAVVAEMLAG